MEGTPQCCWERKGEAVRAAVVDCSMESRSHDRAREDRASTGLGDRAGGGTGRKDA